MAAAPVYFDIGGLLLFGAIAAIVFIVLVVTLARAKSKSTRTLCLLGLASYVVVPIVLSVLSSSARQVPRGKYEPWTLFERERSSMDSIVGPKLVNLCARNRVDQSLKHEIVGIRLLEAKHLPEAPARGWVTGLDFFVGGTRVPGRIDEPASIVEALQNSARELRKALEREGSEIAPFVEYQTQDGRWKRYEVPVGSPSFAELDAVNVQASHGLRFSQVKTGLERSDTIYAGSIEIVELSTGKVVGRHFSYTSDRYWGAHNHYSLFPSGHCAGLPLGVDFLTHWLEPQMRR